MLLTALLAVVTWVGCGPREEARGELAWQGARQALSVRGRGPVQGVLSTSQIHSLALHADGTVWSWGGHGLVGDGTNAERPTPVRVPGLTDVVFVSSTVMDNAIEEHSLAVRADGSVWGWGANRWGQLGDGTRVSPRTAPVRVEGLTDVVAASAGADYSLALREDGSVWAWGGNFYGQLGDGTTAPHFTPVKVDGLTDVVAVSASGFHSLALREDGTVWAWGSNDFGQLGDGTTAPRFTPVKVNGLTDVVAVSAGGIWSLALRADGTVWAWGGNFLGALGDGTTLGRPTPGPVMGLEDVVAISAGSVHSLALRRDGTVWAWGLNDAGQLGNGRYSPWPPELLAAPMAGVDGVVALAAGSTQSLLLRQDGTLWALGRDRNSRLGTGSGARFSPVRALGLEGASSVSAGATHSVAVRQDGTVALWGDPTGLFPASPTALPFLTPVSVAGLTDVERVAAGSRYTLVLRREGTVWGWGSNSSGQLGDGTNLARATPVRVLELPEVKDLAVSSSGVAYALALGRDGSVWAWGANSAGQLGDGTKEARNKPVRVLEGGVVAVAAGFGQSLAVRADGTVLSWGWDGAGGARVTPTPVPGLSGAVSVAIGQSASFAVRVDGTVLSWPHALYRVPAGGAVDASLLPAPVPGLRGVISVSASFVFTLALRADGTVLAWGRNTSGVLGRETDALDNPVPTPVPGLTDVVSLSAGDSHAVAVRADGTVWSWGRNEFGQMGDGISPLHTTPAQVRLPCRFTGLPSLGERNSTPVRCGG